MANDQYSVSIVLKGSNQLSQPVGQAQQSLKGLTQEAGRTNQAMSQLKSVGMGLFAGVTLAGVARFTEDLYQSGMEMQRTTALYKSFGAQVGDTDRLLERLRQTTRGVVKDTDLMSAASQMLSMGLAKNADDVQRLTDIGVTFAQATGQDVGASLENLNMILANQSYLRLDSLGISSSQVRQIAQQYQRAGMDSSEAFTQAFLDVAEGKLPQMAAVADATVTEFQKLQTSMDNFWADFGNRFAAGVNTMVEIAQNGGILIRAALFGEGSAQAGNTAANSASIQAMAGAQGAQYAATLPGYDPNDAHYQFVAQAMANNIASLLGYAQNTGASIGDMALDDVRQIIGATSLTSDDQIRMFREWAAAAQAAGVQAGIWAQQSSQLDRELNQLNQTAGGGFSLTPGTVDPMVEQRNLTLGGVNNWLQAIRGEMGQYGSSFMSSGSAREIRMAADEIQRMVDEAMQLNEVNPGFLSEQNVALLSQMADEAGSAADQAERMASALENASLSQLFGQTSGGRLGEIDAAVLASLEAGGASQELLDAYRTAMGLDSGQLTAMSEQFNNEVLPMLDDIASQLGVDAYNRFRRAYEDAATGAAAAGQSTVDNSWMGGLTYYPGSGTGTGGSYTVQPGDTASGIAAQFGIGVGDFGLANPSLIMPGQQLTWGGAGGGMLVDQNFDPLEQAMLNAETSVANISEDTGTIVDDMTTAVDTLSTGIQGVFNQQYDLPINLVITAAGRDAVTELVRSIVQSNGGTTPGSSNYNSRGGSSGSIGQFAGGHKPT